MSITQPPPKEMHEIDKPLAFIKCGQFYSIQYYDECDNLRETPIKYSRRELMQEYEILTDAAFEYMVG